MSTCLGCSWLSKAGRGEPLVVSQLGDAEVVYCCRDGRPRQGEKSFCVVNRFLHAGRRSGRVPTP